MTPIEGLSPAGVPRPPVHWPGLNGAPDLRFELIVMGDVRLEVRATLSRLRFTEVSTDRLTYAPAHAIVAGTAVNFARRAGDYFRSISVLAKIGDDDFTPVIQRQLGRLGVRGLLRVEPRTANGVSVMLRENPGDRGGQGARLLVAGEEAPSRLLSAADVQSAGEEIRRADVLFADGYALLAPASRAALLTGVRLARSAGTFVAFDLVPHDLDGRLPASTVLPVLAEMDAIITEAPTLAGLLGLPAPTDSSGVRRLLPELDARIHARPLWLMRFGTSHMERALAYRRDGLLLEYPTGYGEGVERTGFGDRLTAGELYWWLSLSEASGA